jgi:hypothetical protein
MNRFSRQKATGQNLTELGLVCGLVILTCVLALTQSGTQISGIFNKVDNGMKTALVNQNSTESTGTMGTLTPDGEAGASPNDWSELHGIPNRDRLQGTGAGSGQYTSQNLNLTGSNQHETEVTGWGGVRVAPEEETTTPSP